MSWSIIIGIFLILIILRAIIPEYKPKCDLCKDKGYIEVNLWYDEVITVDCSKCKNN
jgi:hypothetical protein